jgi:hypothetical protein
VIVVDGKQSLEQIESLFIFLGQSPMAIAVTGNPYLWT